ncbi:AAA family ATPase [Streptomyces sp. NPDC002172]
MRTHIGRNSTDRDSMGPGSAGPGETGPDDAGLVGRDHEKQLITELLAELPRGGRVLRVRGAAGTGRSAVVRFAEAAAGRRGIRVLSTAWASAERTLPYAALHGLLRPELARLGELPAPERAVLDAAFGGGPATPDPAGPAAAALCLLAGAPEPVLLCVDDLDRLDSASRDTLNALARLCGDTHVGMIVAERAAPGTPSAPSDPLTAALEGLPAPEVRILLHRAGRVVGYTEEQLVLAVAGGNPLALTELSLGAGPLGDTAGFGMLPATARLAEAHREDLKGLSVPARSVLLVAALSAAPLARDVLAASTLLLGSTDAARAGLAELTGHGLLTAPPPRAGPDPAPAGLEVPGTLRGRFPSGPGVRGGLMGSFPAWPRTVRCCGEGAADRSSRRSGPATRAAHD